MRRCFTLFSASLGLQFLLVLAAMQPALAASAAVAAAGAAACQNLTSQLSSSKVVTSQLNPQYLESALEYYNLRLSSERPACVVYPTNAHDVSAAVKAIRHAGARFAIKTAGHNPNNGFSSTDGGVLLHLKNLNHKSYDSSSTLGSFGPSGSFGEIYEYFDRFNVTVVGARLAGVGTGLALGGGMSYLSSQYGLAADNFRELEIVLPSGDITTASASKNADLFKALKGSGGNAFGVVTNFTVQTRPSHTFYAGNVIYLASQTASILEAVRDFTRYNTDPKAAIIGTYDRLATPDLGLGLDEYCILFLVYNGPDPGTVFENFTRTSNVLNTLGPKSYVDVVNMPIPGAARANTGDNVFRNAVHHINDDSYRQVLQKWKQWGDANKDKYLLLSLDFQPVPKTLTDASNAQGGNALALPDGPWYWLNFLLTARPGLSDDDYNAAQRSFKKLAESVPSATDLPMFPNDCAKDQECLRSLSTFSELQATKAKYDPDNYFSEYTNGWSFSS